MENHQPFPLPRILERQQRLQKLSLQKAMRFLLHDKRVGRHGDPEQADAFTKMSNGKRIYVWRKQTIERSFATPWPALCAHAQTSQHA